LVVAGVGLVVLLAAILLLWSSGEGGSTTTFCTSLRAGDNPIDVFDRYDPTDVSSAKAQLEQGVNRLEQLERAAPSEIHNDMKVLVDVAQQLVAALDPSAANRPTPDFSSQFDRVRAASGNVTRFAADRCSVSLDSGSSAAPATLPPGTPTSKP
jgi:hypothetical protein